MQSSFPTTWDYSPLLPQTGEKGFLVERKISEKEIKAFAAKYRKDKRFLQDAHLLRLALDEYEKLAAHFVNGGREEYYYDLQNSVDQADSKIRAKLNQITDFVTQLDQELDFFTLELAKIPKEKQSEFLASEELSDYRHQLERIFEKSEHYLTEEGEKVDAMFAKTAYADWVDMVSKFVSGDVRNTQLPDGSKAKKAFPELLSLLAKQEKDVRDNAAKNINMILKKYVDVAEVELNAILQNRKVEDTLRKYTYPQESRLLADNMEKPVVDSLVEAVSASYPIVHQYYALKAKLLGMDKLSYYEKNIEYAAIQQSYTFEKAFTLVRTVFGQLHPKFAQIIDGFREHGQYDVYPKKGKRGGAFCAHSLITQPTYILLNYTDQLNDVLTLAHESGHGINNELMREKQNALNFGVYISTAEVASTFMEDFVLQELMREADKETELALRMRKLEDDVSTIFRQIGIYQFEVDLHAAYRKKGYLTKKDIGKLFVKNMQSYLGDRVYFTKGTENWWMYISHIRRYFYVYTYASGLLISKAMQNRVKADSSFIEKVIDFLSSGCSRSPKDIFADMGIDITQKSFWEQGLTEIQEFLNETEDLAKRLQKI